MPGLLTPGRGRILLTTDAVGGVWRYTLDLAQGMADRGIGSVLAVLGPAASSGQRMEAAGISGVQLVQTGLPLDWTADTRADLARASEELASLAALTAVGSVHLHAPALLGGARWPVPAVVVAHSCVGTWWRAVRGGAVPADFAWRVAATGAGLHGAAAAIAPSRAQGAALREVYGPLSIHVVHNGARPAESVGDVGRSRAVLAAGRLWDDAKGAALLDAAAAEVDAPVRAAGPLAGPNGDQVQLIHCEALGTLDRAGMAREYARSSVFASMARYEPFGLAVLEAAQAGMRLVLSDIPSFRELWDGVAIFVRDPALLPGALRQALDAPQDHRARERAGRYTFDAMVDGTLAVHRGVVG